jgi:hypothetical protein
MAIQVKCPVCVYTLSAPDSAAGKAARCGQCFEIITIPVPDPEPLEIAPEWLEEPTFAEPVRPKPRPRLKAIPVPKPPPSRGLVLGLVATLAFVLLVTVAGLGYVFWLVQHADWKTHEPHGGYRVDLPGPPRDLARLNRMKPDPNVHTFGTIRGLTNEEYGVIWMDIEPWRRSLETDEVILDAAVRELQKENAGIRIDADRPLRQNGFAAREVVMSGGKLDGLYVCRLVVAETRFFMVIVGGGAIGPESENTRRFLDSFEVKKQAGR